MKKMNEKTVFNIEASDDHPQQRCPLKFCRKEFGRIADAAVVARIQQHLIEDHNIHKTKGTTCPLCGKTYAVLRIHIRRAHLTQKTSLVKWHQRLVWHVPLVESLVYYTCRQCGKRTNNKHSLKLHVKFHLKNPSTPEWTVKRTPQPEPVDVSTELHDEETEHCNVADEKAIDNDVSKKAIMTNMGISNTHQKMESGNSVRTSTSQDDALQNVNDVIILDSESDASQSEHSNDRDALMLKEESEMLDESRHNQCTSSENGFLESGDEEVDKEEFSQDDLIDEIERFMQEEDLGMASQLGKHTNKLKG